MALSSYVGRLRVSGNNKSCSYTDCVGIRDATLNTVRIASFMRLCVPKNFWRRERRRFAASMALVAYAVATFGWPLPAAAVKDRHRPFPCQNRPCSCLTADECWKGDCCCFTLEEKLAWAEASGIEPPAHVRPLVESRRSAPPQNEPCCRGTQGCHEPSDHNCPACTAKCSEKGCENKNGAYQPRVRWLLGLFRQKCRGEGPAAFQLPPTVLPNASGRILPVAEPAGHVVSLDCRVISTSDRPLTPPPRCS
jgi:hypothetical protein